MNTKVAKKINKYSELRGAGNPAFEPKLLKKVYDMATPERKKLYEKEMDEYFKAIEQKKIKVGQSILHKVISDIE